MTAELPPPPGHAVLGAAADLTDWLSIMLGRKNLSALPLPAEPGSGPAWQVGEYPPGPPDPDTGSRPPPAVLGVLSAASVAGDLAALAAHAAAPWQGDVDLAAVMLGVDRADVLAMPASTLTRKARAAVYAAVLAYASGDHAGRAVAAYNAALRQR